MMIKSKIPLISVGIPVFNGENYIRESVDSVLRQTENNFELIVVDNCSTDNTLKILASYSDPRIRVVKNDSNLGSTLNFIRCAELAQGEYFVLLPHDDILMPTMLETFSKALSLDPEIGLAYSSYYVINENGKQTDLRIATLQDKILSAEEAIKECIIYGCLIQCAMVRTKLFTFDKNQTIWGDMDLWCRIFLAGNKAAYFKTPQNCVRVHAKQGQRIYAQRDKCSDKILSDHLGYTPSEAFLRNNTYHLLTFKHFQTLFKRIPINSDLQKLRPLSVKWIFGAQVKDLIISLKQGNWKDVKQDINLIIELFRWAGFFKSIPVLLSMLLGKIKRYIKRRDIYNENYNC